MTPDCRPESEPETTVLAAIATGSPAGAVAAHPPHRGQRSPARPPRRRGAPRPVEDADPIGPRLHPAADLGTALRRHARARPRTSADLGACPPASCRCSRRARKSSRPEVRRGGSRSSRWSAASAGSATRHSRRARRLQRPPAASRGGGRSATPLPAVTSSSACRPQPDGLDLLANRRTDFTSRRRRCAAVPSAT